MIWWQFLICAALGGIWTVICILLGASMISSAREKEWPQPRYVIAEERARWDINGNEK